jgi:hypothetical protein
VAAVIGRSCRSWLRESAGKLDDEEGNRLLPIIRRGSGSVVTSRRAQMVLLSAQGMSVARIAEVAFTSEDQVRDVVHNFTDGFDSRYPKYRGGRPPTFTLPQRREIKKIAGSKRSSTGCRSRPGATAIPTTQAPPRDRAGKRSLTRP